MEGLEGPKLFHGSFLPPRHPEGYARTIAELLRTTHLKSGYYYYHFAPGRFPPPCGDERSQNDLFLSVPQHERKEVSAARTVTPHALPVVYGVVAE